LAFILLSIRAEPYTNQNSIQEGGDIMKKITVELFIIAATVMAYVLPVLADGGAW